ncbi:hypothetical protein GW17_00020506 [Ensete ventricosum]|nr:hypothetical protein GW17_00020506 [Ensete ventricosum]
MPSSRMRSESSCSITTPREESETMASWNLEQGFKDRCHGIEYKCATGFDWSSFVTCCNQAWRGAFEQGEECLRWKASNIAVLGVENISLNRRVLWGNARCGPVDGKVPQIFQRGDALRKGRVIDPSPCCLVANLGLRLGRSYMLWKERKGEREQQQQRQAPNRIGQRGEEKRGREGARERERRVLMEETLKALSLDYLNLLINGQAFSDVTFSVEGRLVHAHRCILAARSLFFRRFFCGTDPPSPGLLSSPRGGAASPGAAGGAVIPVNSVSYEVFLMMLQFLYSGQVSVVPQKHEPRPGCGERGCWHTHCTAAVDLALDTLTAARSFGVKQLEQITEHLPIDVVARIEELRLKTSLARRSSFVAHHHQIDVAGSSADLEDHHHKIRRMRRALDSSDVELVKLMVMGEGLNLDDALALHYAVENCSREVVKALLELGAADVNSRAGPTGKTPLHVAAEMVCPDMVAVLLDHHADPNVRTVDGVTPLDILRTLTSDFLFKGAVPGLSHIEPNKLRLCLELVQSAALVISREEANCGGGTGGAGSNPSTTIYPRMNPGTGACDASSSTSGMVNLSLDSRMVYLNLGMAAQFGGKMNDGGGDGSSSSRSQDGGGGIGPSSMYPAHGFP